MKKIKIVLFVLLIASIHSKAQKKKLLINFQLHTVKNIYKANVAPTLEKTSSIGVGVGLHLERKIAKIPLILDPMFLYSKRGITDANNIRNLKTTYVQLPVMLRLFSKEKYFENEVSNNTSVSTSVGDIVVGGSRPTSMGATGFKFTFDAGAYIGMAVGGNYNGSIKMKYGEGLTDNRSRIDYGLTATFSAGFPKDLGSNMRFYIQGQKGLKNVIPEARVANGATRKLNSFNVGLTFGLGKK